MLKRITLPLIMATAFCCLLAMPVLAADLQVQLNNSNKTMIITNSLQANVYVMAFVSGSSKIPVNARLEAGESAEFSVQGSLPAAIDSATCNILGAAPAGYQRGADGFYHLSVQKM